LFNRREFWKAHESWESVWLASHGTQREFLQGLIQLAAVCYHVERENVRGAARLLEASLGRLDSLPESFGGIALGELRDQARGLDEVTPAEFVAPSIRLLSA
jgi:hypothetical protein